MNLEDHLGDILRKGRMMSNLPPAAAAKAVGLSEDELTALEDAGQTGAKLNFATLAPLIGLDSAKLEMIANGWLPSPKHLSHWRDLHVFTTTGEDLTVNCYLIWDPVSREAALFDTGWEASPILKLLTDEKLELRHLFITHLHHDHVAEIGAIRKAFPEARLHSNSKTTPADQHNHPDDCIQLGRLRITNRPTPGHAEEGATYIIDHWPDNAPPVAVVGDAIFAGSMGRGNQSWELARQAVREHILTLPPATLLCPGHGPLTTVSEETTANPFF